MTDQQSTDDELSNLPPAHHKRHGHGHDIPKSEIERQKTDDAGESTGEKTGDGPAIPQSEIDRQDADHADS